MLVEIVDDDDGMRNGLLFVLRQLGISARGYSNAAAALSQWDTRQRDVLVVDYLMPNMTGLELIENVRSCGDTTPFILITGQGTVSMAVKAMKMGAVTVLEKPFHHDELIEMLTSIELSEKTSNRVEQDDVIHRINSLTARESEIMELVIQGSLTKQIAKQLSISTKTVEVHRSNITRKMGVQSVAQLVAAVISMRMSTSR